jgi:hypothetical protein
LLSNSDHHDVKSSSHQGTVSKPSFSLCSLAVVIPAFLYQVAIFISSTQFFKSTFINSISFISSSDTFFKNKSFSLDFFQDKS